jgi:hypothetical protein
MKTPPGLPMTLGNAAFLRDDPVTLIPPRLLPRRD